MSPYAPPRPCVVPRCAKFATYRGRCSDHAYQQRTARADASGDAFYSSRTWRRYRIWFLNAHPLCEDTDPRCLARPHAANEVDHIQPRRERPDLTFEESNCRALCKVAHSRKTARQDGGFGR